MWDMCVGDGKRRHFVSFKMAILQTVSPVLNQGTRRLGYYTVMITLRQRIIKLSFWDKDLFHDLLRDTHEKSLNFEWLRIGMKISIAFSGKPWVGKVSLDKTQFKILNVRKNVFGKHLSTVLIYGKAIAINNERWLKLTYTISWYVLGSFAFSLAFLAYIALTIPLDAITLLFIIGFVISPPAYTYWDLRQSDKRILKYMHESRTKVYEAALASNTKKPQHP